MNTTDYFTYINAMFLFCIFTCGLLVWAVIRGYILKGKLTKEQDAHLKATNTNTLLNKALSAKNAGLQSNECKLRDAEKEIRDLQSKLDHAEADRIELRAERATLENQLAASKRVRNAKGVFVRKDGTYTPKEKINRWDRFKVNSETLIAKELKAVKVKPLPTIADEVVEPYGLTASETVKIAESIEAQKKAKEQPKPHTLRHGMTVKNPTEKEAKEIFDAARVAGVSILGTKKHRNSTVIWFSDSYGIAWGNDRPVTGEVFMAASEFIARIKGEVG